MVAINIAQHMVTNRISLNCSYLISKLFYTGYDVFGYDKDGYDRLGYNSEGYDREGFNIQGYNRIEEYDGILEYNKEGYNVEGFNRSGNNHQILFSLRENNLI